MARQRLIQTPSTHTHPRQQGIAMIEVLVTMMIIAMWLLATAGMQAGMFKLQTSASSRLKAIELATELSERMEANSGAAKAGKYALAPNATVAAPTDCASVACSPADLAMYDLKQWSDRVASALVVDSISVTQDTMAAQPTYSISISWKEPRGRQTYLEAGSTELARYIAIKVLG